MGFDIGSLLDITPGATSNYIFERSPAIAQNLLCRENGERLPVPA
jgi:hypothetical protein